MHVSQCAPYGVIFVLFKDEIAATASRLTALRSHEQVLRDKLLKLESDRRAIQAIDTKVRIDVPPELSNPLLCGV